MNTSNEVVGVTGVPTSGATTQAFSVSPAGSSPVDFLSDDPQYTSFTDPASTANAIDDAGEIGGGIINQPGPGTVSSDAYIYDPGAAAGSRLTLFPDAYETLGLSSDWAEVWTDSPVDSSFAQDTALELVNRATGSAPTVTNLVPVGEQNGFAPFLTGLASDGTLVGDTVTTDASTGNGVDTPTMRLPNGNEVTLQIPSGDDPNVSEAEDVNASHYAVGFLRENASGDNVAALWTAQNQAENLNTLIPSNSGWVLDDAVGIADDGAIAGYGTLDGTPENFLLTVNNSLPTTTTGSCSPGTVGVQTVSTCTFTVTDTTPSSTQTPTGTVTVSSNLAGALSASDCTLNPASNPNAATCSVSFTPSASGTATLTLEYSGDGEHGSSTGSATLTASPSSSGTGGSGGSGSGGSGGSGSGGSGGSAGSGSSSGTGAGTSSSSGAAGGSGAAQTRHDTTRFGHVTVSGDAAKVPVACTSSIGASCHVTLTLTVTRTVQHKRRTVRVGSATLTVPAGLSRTVKLSLSPAGRKLLKADHHLTVKLTNSVGGKASTLTFRSKPS